MIRRTLRQLIMTSEWPSSAATLKMIQENVSHKTPKMRQHFEFILFRLDVVELMDLMTIWF